MDKKIYIVERWLVHPNDHDEYIYAGVFCFEERHVAEAFAAKMESEAPSTIYFMSPDSLFTNVDDAVAAARGQ